VPADLPVLHRLVEIVAPIAADDVGRLRYAVALEALGRAERAVRGPPAGIHEYREAAGVCRDYYLGGNLGEYGARLASNVKRMELLGGEWTAKTVDREGAAATADVGDDVTLAVEGACVDAARGAMVLLSELTCSETTDSRGKAEASLRCVAESLQDALPLSSTSDPAKIHPAAHAVLAGIRCNVGIARYLLAGDAAGAVKIWEEALASLPNGTASEVSYHLRCHLCTARLAQLKSVPVGTERDELLKSAADAADDALREFDSVPTRALVLAGRCRAAAGQAVTAEGLYRSALEHLVGEGDVPPPDLLARAPLSLLEATDACHHAQKLYLAWDGREGDARRAGEAKERVTRWADEIFNEGCRGWVELVQREREDRDEDTATILCGMWSGSVGDFLTMDGDSSEENVPS